MTPIESDLRISMSSVPGSSSWRSGFFPIDWLWRIAHAGERCRAEETGPGERAEELGPGDGAWGEGKGTRAWGWGLGRGQEELGPRDRAGVRGANRWLPPSGGSQTAPWAAPHF